jgi:hypothetical protein
MATPLERGIEWRRRESFPEGCQERRAPDLLESDIYLVIVNVIIAAGNDVK